MYLFIVLGLFAGPAVQAGEIDHSRSQADCENDFINSLKAEEILEGPEYEIFLEVVTVFKRDNPPRLYFSPGYGNAVYIARSVISDGRGKILIAEELKNLLGVSPALRAIFAHEMAHLVLDKGEAGCDSLMIRSIKVEEETDALAAHTIGFEPMRELFLKTESREWSKCPEIPIRLQTLNKLESEDKKLMRDLVYSLF